MKKPTWVRKSGPYQCLSLANGYLLVKPSWPQYSPVWNHLEGGGPGVFNRMHTAELLEKWLNSCYTAEEMAVGRVRIAQHDENLIAADRENSSDTPDFIWISDLQHQFAQLKAEVQQLRALLGAKASTSQEATRKGQE